MPAPIITATVQAALLGALSNTLGQAITAYQNSDAWRVHLSDILVFALFSLLACPPNYIWQSWLEATFPGFTDQLTPREKEKLVDDAVAGQATGAGVESSNVAIKRTAAGSRSSAVESNGEGMKGEGKGRTLNRRNTVMKIALDQTIGAGANTVLFICGMGILKSQPWNIIISNLQTQFWPMIFAGQRFWPLISILSFTLVPLESRTLFGSVVGVVWGVYLSLLSGSDR